MFLKMYHVVFQYCERGNNKFYLIIILQYLFWANITNLFLLKQTIRAASEKIIFNYTPYEISSPDLRTKHF